MIVAPDASAIRVTKLVKSFGPDRRIADGLDLAVARGEAVSIIGANGAGKSTLLRLLVGLVPPDDGEVHLLGAPVTRLKGRALAASRARVGFVFQKHNLVSRLSALSNVLHGVQARRAGPRTWHQALARREDREEAMACLDAVGLADLARQRVDSLSGGQSQRVAVARMLMQRPELVLADEPDASLDPRAGAEVMGLLARLSREKGLTLVFVSHHMAHAVAFADRVVGLAGGRVALDERAATSDPDRLAAFFDEPPPAPGDAVSASLPLQRIGAAS
ncbi:phosphonate ABC transporter ATP-binding protein [Salinarimonas ramus]|uniref:Phosphate-import ATP-binding protein PhnC n=1 Tax=Salinarimonas ramus TaxID=690164 RepID=A0A917V6B2_9HYPH|nr:ATP-binding cassette domain-containing protein [Salinarimonas ramus]GGK44132.1 phosphate-import ATP-binding protein PhnC [Salinarimonas ramus]